jgi:hypothetical protein
MFYLRAYLWFAPNVLFAICLVGLLRRKLQRSYPFLVTYLAFEVIGFVTLFTIDRLIAHSLSSLETYRWVLVVDTGVTAAFQLGAIYELAQKLVLSRSAVATSLRQLLRWSLASLLLISVTSAAMFHQSGLGRVMSAFQTMDFCGSLIGVGLLVILLLFSRALGLSWRSLPAGIVLGFGVNGSAEILAAALISLLGSSGYVAIDSSGYVAIDIVRMTAAHIRAVIWLVYILRPERPSFTKGNFQKADLDAWSQDLEKMAPR